MPLASDWRSDLADMMFEDLDHELLHAAEHDAFEDDPGFGPPGMASTRFADWSRPFDRDRRLPPFVEDGLRDIGYP